MFILHGYGDYMVNPSEVEAQLQRILASPTFVGSPRSAQFLSFCVFRGSTGKAVDLKETTIAVEVFKRAPDYDPKSDPIVRVHARRVRDKLTEYYQTQGNKDPILIDLPKGGYVPRFSRTLPHRKTDFSDWRDQGDERASPPSPTLDDARSPRRSHPLVVACMLLGLMTIAGFALLPGYSNSSEATVRATGVALPAGVKGHVSNPVWSPDGVHLAYTLTEPSGSSHIYIDAPGGTSPPERVTQGDGAEMRAAWSRMGRT